MNPEEIEEIETEEVVQINENSMLDSFVTVEDVQVLFVNIVVIAFLAFLIGRVIVFVPDFMKSILRKVKNKSVIYSNDTVHDPKLEPTLDQSDFGFKNLMDRWFKL